MAPRLAALVVAVAVAGVAGCGGDDDEDRAARTTATAAPATTATTEPDQDARGTSAAAAPGGVVREYFAALSRRDGDRACTYMTSEMRRIAIRSVTSTIKNSGVTRCGDAMRKIVGRATDADLRTVSNVKILKTTISGDTARVKVERADRDAELTKTGDRWLISGGIFGS